MANYEELIKVADISDRTRQLITVIVKLEDIYSEVYDIVGSLSSDVDSTTNDFSNFSESIRGEIYKFITLSIDSNIREQFNLSPDKITNISI